MSVDLFLNCVELFYREQPVRLDHDREPVRHIDPPTTLFRSHLLHQLLHKRQLDTNPSLNILILQANIRLDHYRERRKSDLCIVIALWVVLNVVGIR